MDSWGNEKSPSLSGEGLCTSANRCFHDLPRLARRLAFGQRVDMVHAVDHFAPDGILIVEEARIFEADEELAVGAVRILRARHRTDAADMRFGAEFGGQVGKLAAPHGGGRPQDLPKGRSEEHT